MQWEVGEEYRISYRSESGTITERNIDLLRISTSYGGTVFLRAFCHLRGEERTFRADRVLNAERHAQVTQPAPSPLPTMPTPKQPSYSVPRAPDRIPAPMSQARPRKSVGDVLGTLFGYALALTFMIAFLSNTGILQYLASHTSSYTPVSNYSVAPAPAKIPRPTPSPPPLPSVEDASIAGYTLRTRRDDGVESYEVLELGLRTTNKIEAIAALRLTPFVEATGITDPALIGRYLEADLNSSGRLSFDELTVFQKKTYREFRYESNEVALRPDEFLAAGGGDCDDFALYTAGLLRFWGWEPYLGCLETELEAALDLCPRKGLGHSDVTEVP